MISSIRRECIDHVVVLGERHLRHVLLSYKDYYNATRTHFDAIALAHHLKYGSAMQGWNWRGWFINIIDAHGHKVDEVAILDV